MNNFQVIKPFGPSILKVTIPDQIISNMNNYVDEIIESKGLVQIQDESLLEGIAQQVVDANPDQVNAYKNGKEKLFGFFVGQVMKETQGKANPNTINKILKDLLNSSQ